MLAWGAGDDASESVAASYCLPEADLTGENGKVGYNRASAGPSSVEACVCAGVAARSGRQCATTRVGKAALRRCARRAGCDRIQGVMYETMEECLRQHLHTIIRDAIVYSSRARRKTIMRVDVLYSLKLNGAMLYGMGDATMTNK